MCIQYIVSCIWDFRINLNNHQMQLCLGLSLDMWWGLREWYANAMRLIEAPGVGRWYTLNKACAIWVLDLRSKLITIDAAGKSRFFTRRFKKPLKSSNMNIQTSRTGPQSSNWSGMWVPYAWSMNVQWCGDICDSKISMSLFPISRACWMSWNPPTTH